MERNTTRQELAEPEVRARVGSAPRVEDPSGSQPVPLQAQREPEQRRVPSPTEDAIPKNNRRHLWTVAGLMVALAAALLTAWAFVRPTPDVEPVPGNPELNIPE